jgi:Zn-dependent M16 (insulinase) family peptidase
VYGKQTGEDLERATKDLKYYDQLSEFTEQQWIQYLKKYFLNNHHITLLGKPSADFAKKLSKQEEQRVEKQRETLGKEKLNELEKRLDEAKKLNDVSIPSHIIENFPVPNVDSIPFINVITGRNKSEGKLYVFNFNENLIYSTKSIPIFLAKIRFKNISIMIQKLTFLILFNTTVSNSNYSY